MLALWLWLDSSGILGSEPPTSGRPAAFTPSPAGSAQPTATASVTIVAKPTADGRFTIEVSEQELNALLTQYDTPFIDNVQVTLTAGKVRLEADAKDPLPGTLTAEGLLVVSDGKLRLVVQKAQVGPLPLPQAMTDLLEDQANQALANVDELQSYTVERVEVRLGRARVTVSR